LNRRGRFDACQPGERRRAVASRRPSVSAQLTNRDAGAGRSVVWHTQLLELIEFFLRGPILARRPDLPGVLVQIPREEQ